MPERYATTGAGIALVQSEPPPLNIIRAGQGPLRDAATGRSAAYQCHQESSRGVSLGRFAAKFKGPAPQVGGKSRSNCPHKVSCPCR